MRDRDGAVGAESVNRRVLVTGASGFVGGHLVRACVEAGDEVIAPPRGGEGALDLLDGEATRATVRAAAPDAVYHLAALASVARSWQDPAPAVTDNLAMTLSLLEAVRLEAHGARVLVAGSGEVYGPPAALPVAETAPLRPQNPYAVAKAATDLLAGFYADAHGLAVLRPRAFNHAGPGQSTTFAVASFAAQVAAARLAGQHPVRVVTGNADTRRDFTDVRDVVRAYRLLVERAEPGIYNVCSGRATSIRQLVAGLGAAAGVRVEHVVDAERVRPHEVAEIRGSHDRLTAATEWQPEIPLERTLADTVAWWEERLAARAAG